MSAILLFLLLLPAAASVIDTPAVRIDSAFQLLNAGRMDSASNLARTIDPHLLSPPLQSRASRLVVAGLQEQPGNHAWMDWMAKFDPQVWSLEEKSWIARQALDAGFFQIAAVLINASGPANPALRHTWEIFQVRLNAAQGEWKQAEIRLNAWRNDPRRTEGSGEILFWQGWTALHQHHREQADTLFTLAGAYVEERLSQRALEYRYAILLDSSGALYDYIRGLPESPLPYAARKSSLQQVPASSPLHPYALWETALLSGSAGNKEGELTALQELAKDPSSLSGRRAAVRLTRLRFEPDQPDSAMASYENLLLQYQQGVPSEFARSRIQALRVKPAQKPPL